MPDLAIKVENVSKAYTIWRDPAARLKHPFLDLAGELFPALRPRIDQKMQGLCTEFYALKDVSFEVKKGESVGIIGRNGSGKSTLLQIIAGTLQPTEGSVTVNGRVAALLELGSGFNPEFTGRENVYLNCSILGLSKEETDARFQSIADFADIGDFLEQPVKTYSSGMAMRLGFAVAINVDPEILIVDEALSVGDERFQRKCFSRIEEIKQLGATILFVSHSGAQIIELCDQCILLYRGEKLLDGIPKKVVSQYHKILFSSEDQAAEMKEELLNNNYSSNIVEEKNSTYSEWKSTYDPSLTPSSTLTYESKGAIVSINGIFTKDGRRVNNLIKKENYIFEYEVSLSKKSYGLKFCTLIKSITGVELGGYETPIREHCEISLTKELTKIKVRYGFSCTLSSGTYFVNAGVKGFHNNEEIYLHRIIDAAMFRVLPEENPKNTGMIDFSFEPKVEIYE
jgi:lipopolysaccharide transport system ATP-binding protein